MHSRELTVISVVDGVATLDDRNRERKLLVHFAPHAKLNSLFILKIESDAACITRRLKTGSEAYGVAGYKVGVYVKRCLANIQALATRCKP